MTAISILYATSTYSKILYCANVQEVPSVNRQTAVAFAYYGLLVTRYVWLASQPQEPVSESGSRPGSVVEQLRAKRGDW